MISELPSLTYFVALQCVCYAQTEFKYYIPIYIPYPNIPCHLKKLNILKFCDLIIGVINSQNKM